MKTERTTSGHIQYGWATYIQCVKIWPICYSGQFMQNSGQSFDCLSIHFNPLKNIANKMTYKVQVVASLPNAFYT